MNHQEELVYRFKSQADFARTYSPLYAKLFAFVAEWIEVANGNEGASQVGEWLISTSKSRNPFDVTLLLMAGLHEAVLAKHEGSAQLAQFYPTANGTRSPDDAELSHILKIAITNLQTHLAHVIQTATVQTNETGRGSSWLLPLAFTSWNQVELLDLGASAGLNLVAEQRRFDFCAKASGEHLLTLGNAAEAQMTIEISGDFFPIEKLESTPQIPQIVGRLGVDLLPFPIQSEADATRLTSYVWGDQPERIERLSQALIVHQTVQQSAAPVQLGAVRLPGELSPFLDKLPSDSTVPLLIYNTYITQYFKNERAQLDESIKTWAAEQQRPVLWIQWEPQLEWGEKPREEEYGWCAWTADLWQDGAHQNFHLAWVHPHGLQARFLTGLQNWADFWRK